MRMALALVLAACAPTVDTAGTTSELTGTCRETRLLWGSGSGELGLSPDVPESLAAGPPAAAVSPTGDVLVLDAINGRVIAVDPRGDSRVVATVARDADAIAVGEDGAFVVYSPLQSRAWWFEADGRAAGELAIDRTVRHVVGIAMTTSRRLVLETAYQESFVAGSPHAPVALATMLEGKREGVAGLGVAVRAAGGHAELLVHDDHPGRKATIRATYPLPGSVDAAMVIGATGNTACVRTERLAAQAPVNVERRAVCLDVATGRVVADLALGKPAAYRPRNELAVGGSTLVVLDPQPDAMVVKSCEVLR